MNRQLITDAICDASTAIAELEDAERLGYSAEFKYKICSAEENLRSAVNKMELLQKGINNVLNSTKKIYFRSNSKNLERNESP